MYTLYVINNVNRVVHFQFQNASSDVDKMILGNKCDLSESRVVSTERGKLVREWYGNGS